jgi:large subunit ribosomal protein L3
MIRGFWGKKLGMTQIFSESKVVPVTVVEISHWFVLGVKTEERDGYHSVVVGRVRKRFEGQPFSNDWLKKLKDYFGIVKEIKLKTAPEVTVGQPVNFHEAFEEGALVDVGGVTKGCGFAGVVRRHNFAGGRASHGDTMGKRTGSIGFMCACGKVIKGKKMPGHMGAKKKTVQNAKIVKIEKDSQVVLIKGAIPGKSGSMVFVQSGVKA